MQEPKVSVVIPLFNEEENLPELYRRLIAALTGCAASFELVLVNDGSRDATGTILDALAQADERVTGIHLSRNFGHQAAVTAGIDHARGKAVIVMDGDLQDPPEVLGQFLDVWREGYDVVYAIRTKRKEGPIKRAAYALFYRLLRATSDLDIPLDSGDFCLMDRKVVDALRQLPERQRFIRGLRTFVGFRQTGLCYERDARHAGKPKYTFKALSRLAIDGLLSFSAFPLSLVTYFGLFSLFLAIGLTVWVLADAFFENTAPRGWASIMVVMLYLGAVQLLSLGIVAEYVRRIFLESKQRPTYLVARLARAETAAPIRRSA
jgi:dolichol-phosphate mannosyltransferase